MIWATSPAVRDPIKPTTHLGSKGTETSSRCIVRAHVPHTHTQLIFTHTSTNTRTHTHAHRTHEPAHMRAHRHTHRLRTSTQTFFPLSRFSHFTNFRCQTSMYIFCLIAARCSNIQQKVRKGSGSRRTRSNFFSHSHQLSINSMINR